MRQESDRQLDRRKTAALLQWVFVAYWVALFLGTHWPRLPVELGHSDKWTHFAAFAGLAVLWTALLALRNQLTAARCAIVWLVLVLYAAADELLQIPVGRHADIRDWYADVAGLTVGILACLLIARQVRSFVARSSG